MSFCRTDATAVAAVPDGWQIHLAAAGVLSVWDGSPLRSEDHHNKLWVRPGPDDPWVLDLTISGGCIDRWIYRRQPAISRPWATAVLIDQGTGVAYLAAELQLLFKSRNRCPKDDVDAAQVIPVLTADEAAWLQAALPNHHAWQQLVTERPG